MTVALHTFCDRSVQLTNAVTAVVVTFTHQVAQLSVVSRRGYLSYRSIGFVGESTSHSWDATINSSSMVGLGSRVDMVMAPATYGVTYVNISWSGRIFKERGVSTKELKLEWQTNDAEVYGSMLWGVWRTVDVSRPVWYLVVYSATRGSHNGRIYCKRIALRSWNLFYSK